MTKVALVANSDWGLYNFRLPLARMLSRRGMKVTLVCPRGKYFQRLEREFPVAEWKMDRRSLHPSSEVATIFRLRKIYRRLECDIVHHFTIKPSIYGTIAARSVSRNIKIINNFTGLGYVFSNAFKAKIIFRCLSPILRALGNSSNVHTVFQNHQDHHIFLRHRFTDSSKSGVIMSTGIDSTQFSPGDRSVSREKLRILMAARLLKQKGVLEFVEAARIIKSVHPWVQFVLAGEPDTGNPDHIPESLVHQWVNEGIIEWLGHSDDMASVLKGVDIACLPTKYNEGVPKFLLEAAATGLPILASDIEGCKMVVEEGVNGFLAENPSGSWLASKIQMWIDGNESVRDMGVHSRRKVVRELDEKIILGQWRMFYDNLKNSSVGSSQSLLLSVIGSQDSK